MLAFILFNEQDKGSNHLSIITWSVLGKQNVQAKKVYWTHRLGFESARAALCKWATCTRQTFLSNAFAISPLNMQKQYEKMFGKKVMRRTCCRYEYRPPSTINQISICFLPQYQRQRKCFLFRAREERELKKALRDTLKRAAPSSVVWLGPSDFWLVRSEHAHASYPGLDRAEKRLRMSSIRAGKP